MLINKNNNPIINNKTLFKGQQFYYCLVEEIYAAYNYNSTPIKVTLDKIYVRSEHKYYDSYGDYRNIVCQHLSLIIDETVLERNNKPFLLITKCGQQGIITTNKQDVLNYIKKMFYNNISNPWSNTAYAHNMQQLYNKTLERLKNM